MKHFSQKWYLSAISPNFGELHRSAKQQSQRGHEDAATNQGRAGQGRAGQRVSRHRRGAQDRVVVRAANHDARFTKGRVGVGISKEGGMG